MKIQNDSNSEKNKKDAGNNQWTNTHRKIENDNRERKDGPGGD